MGAGGISCRDGLSRLDFVMLFGKRMLLRSSCELSVINASRYFSASGWEATRALRLHTPSRFAQVDISSTVHTVSLVPAVLL